MKLLVLDNYDSFTYNLVHLIEKVSDVSFDVVLNDKIKLEEIDQYDQILLSPGPGLPAQAGIMPQLLKKYHQQKSILGVCLGMQAIGETFGGTLSKPSTVFHGIATAISTTDSDPLFRNCSSTFMGGRYHSWVVDKKNLPSDLEITAEDKNGLIMGLRHKQHNVRGVQFHPESILSEYGETIIKNWLEIPLQ